MDNEIINRNNGFFVYKDKKVMCQKCGTSKSGVMGMVGFWTKCEKCSKEFPVFTTRKKVNKKFFITEQIENDFFGYYVYFKWSFESGFEIIRYLSYKKINGEYYRKNISLHYWQVIDTITRSNIDGWLKCTKRFNEHIYQTREYMHMPDYFDDTRKLIYENYNICKYIKPRQLANLSIEHEDFKGVDFTALQHLIQRTNNHYCRLFLDENYNVLKFNKHELKFILSEQLTINQLKVFEKIKKTNVEEIDREFERIKNAKFDKKIKKVANNKKHLEEKEFQKFRIKAIKSVKELKSVALELENCLKTYVDKINEKKFILILEKNGKSECAIKIVDNEVHEFLSKNNNNPNKAQKKALKELLKKSEIKFQKKVDNN